jgi:hypothetical protein
VGVLPAVCERHQEAGDALAGALAAQHHHVVLQALHLLTAGLQDRPVQLSVAGEGAHGAAAHHVDLAVGEGLGAEAVVGPRLQAEQVARIVEVADLAAAVEREAAGADHAADHPVEHLDRVVLGVDLGVALVGHPRAVRVRRRRSARRRDGRCGGRSMG